VCKNKEKEKTGQDFLLKDGVMKNNKGG